MKRAGPGWFLLSLGGLAAIVGSFLPFYTYAGGVDVTVWSRGLFPTAALIPLLGFAIGVEALFVLLAGHEPRSPFLNFTWEQARMAVGAFMILLVLSYLLQDRAGGSLGVGYLVLSVSALATFAGGVMTRRAQLARAPGEKAPVSEPRPRLKPALVSVGRASSDLVKNAVDRGNAFRARMGERREARQVAGRPAAQKAAQAAEQREKEPPAPVATIDELPKEPPAPVATVDELPKESISTDQPEKATDDAPTKPMGTDREVEKIVEAPTKPIEVAEEPAAKEDEAPAAVTKPNAVTPEPDAYATSPPDGETAPADADNATAESDTDDESDNDKAKEGVESSTES